MIESGETRARVNGAMRDALKKGKIPFIEVSTESREENVIVVTIVTGHENEEAVNRHFADMAKRFKNTDVRLEFKTPELLAKEKAATLRIILKALTSGSPYTAATIAEGANEPLWVINACMRELSQKGIVHTLNEYDDQPTWTIATRNATYEAAIAAARDKGFPVE